MESSSAYLILACIIGWLMAFGIGANDAANAIGTSVGSKALKIRTAIILASIFEAAGALLAGGEVTNTIRNQIVDASLFQEQPQLLVYCMLASSLSAGIWLLIASHQGWPVSTTHTIIGALIGVCAINLGMDSVRWSVVGNIVASWIITPMIAGVFSYLLFYSVHKGILNKNNPIRYAKRYLPLYVLLSALIVSSVTLGKGLQHVGVNLTTYQQLGLSVVFSLCLMGISMLLLRKVEVKTGMGSRYEYKQVEFAFGLLMVFTACTMAFAHGSNDVANAIGPLAAVVDITMNTPLNSQAAAIPLWVFFMGAFGIVSGLVCYGYRVIQIIGEKITDLTPSRGFAAELSAAATVVAASAIGMPVSTTQTLVGAILGVGLAGGIEALDLRVVRNIFMSWIITLPVGAFLAVVFFYFLRGIFCFC